jgi:hypothetical protein
MHRSTVCRRSAHCLPALGLACALMAAWACPAGAYHVYFASLHAHSTYSDGAGTPSQAYTYARDVANVDVLALADHSTYMANWEYASLISIANSYTQDGVFVALASQESGNLNDFGHMNVHDSPVRNNVSTEDLLGNYAFVLNQNAIGSFNHPDPSYGTNFDNLTYYPAYAAAMKGLAIRSGLASSGYEWQFTQALSNGWKVAPIAEQDEHDMQWADQPNPNDGGRIYLTGILADTLTRASIVDALRARRFYAMTISPPNDRIVMNFTVDGQPMGSTTTVGIGPVFSVDASANGISLFNRVYLYKDGVLLSTAIAVGTSIHTEFRDWMSEGESHYYYVRVTQVDGDQAWSAPVWTTAHLDPAAVGPAEPAAYPSWRCLPNPVSGNGLVSWSLPAGHGDAVSLRILDPTGRIVRTLEARERSSGWTWDGLDGFGRQVPSGVYTWMVRGGDGSTQSGRLVRVR